MDQPDVLMAEVPAVLDGTITALGRMPRSESSRVTVNRRWMVIVPSGLSDLFAGMRVRVHGGWHQGARRRYMVASRIEPLDPAPSLSVERLSRALLGTHALNQFLQRVVNPDGNRIGGGYRVGDRVIVIRNDYDGACPVYNGQVGRACGGAATTVAVQLDGGELVHVAMRDLELAYRLTVHKAQGSRYDTVVFVIPPVAADFPREQHMQYGRLTWGRQETVCYVFKACHSAC